jgi:hypothetical protein
MAATGVALKQQKHPSPPIIVINNDWISRAIHEVLSHIPIILNISGFKCV